MSPLDSININHDLITCFYISTSNPFIKTISFDPEDNFTQIPSTVFNASGSFIQYAPIFINGVTNKDKKKAIVYIIFANNFYSMNFDFTNGFSTLHLENNDQYQIQITTSLTKMIYFEETNEFVIASAVINSCKLLIIKYNNEYKMIEKGILDYTNPPCYFTTCFSIIYNGNDYMALNDGETPESLLQSINNIQKIQLETTIIKTTIPTIKTTMIKTTIPTIRTTIIETTIPKIEPTIIKTTINKCQVKYNCPINEFFDGLCGFTNKTSSVKDKDDILSYIKSYI
jgi:hypothetical protein